MPLGAHPAYILATTKASKDTTWSTSWAQVLRIVLNFSYHFVKGKVLFFLVGGAPELLAASYVLCRASPRSRVPNFDSELPYILLSNIFQLRRRAYFGECLTQHISETRKSITSWPISLSGWNKLSFNVIWATDKHPQSDIISCILA